MKTLKQLNHGLFEVHTVNASGVEEDFFLKDLFQIGAENCLKNVTTLKAQKLCKFSLNFHGNSMLRDKQKSRMIDYFNGTEKFIGPWDQ